MQEIINNVNISDIKPFERNARKNDAAVDEVLKSMKRVGYRTPIIVDENNVILCGHTRYKAIKKAGWSKIPFIIRHNDLTEEQKQEYRIRDNKTGEIAEWDFEILEADFTSEELVDFGFEIYDKNIDPIEEKEWKANKLIDKFIVPPFSILDTRQGYWQDRKKAWKERIQDSAETRENSTMINETFKRGNILVEMDGNGVSLLDPVLAEIACRWFGFESCSTFDCFAGDTVFGYVSAYLKNKFVGIELRKDQADINNKRLNEFINCYYICDDGRNVLSHIEENSQDLLFSCPPYFDLEVYSDLLNDASNQKKYSDFINIIDQAFTNSIKCLKDDRFAVIVCGDVRNKKTGEYYRFPDDIKNIFARNGLMLYNEMILVEMLGTAMLRTSGQMRNRKVVKTHQNVLVFYKGDQNNIKSIFPELMFEEVEDESADV